MSIFAAHGPEIVFYVGGLVAFVVAAWAVLKCVWKAGETLAGIKVSLNSLHEKMGGVHNRLDTLNGQVLKNTVFREQHYHQLLEAQKISAAANREAMEHLRLLVEARGAA